MPAESTHLALNGHGIFQNAQEEIHSGGFAISDGPGKIPARPLHFQVASGLHLLPGSKTRAAGRYVFEHSLRFEPDSLLILPLELHTCGNGFSGFPSLFHSNLIGSKRASLKMN
jgi:hypothetical protein